MPTTFGTITQSLLKRFHETGPSIKALNISIDNLPDFKAISLPDDITPAERNKIIHQMTIAYAANLASNTTKSSTPKISIHDIETQCSHDIKLIDNIIEDTMDSFLQGLFQFCHAHEQLCSLTSTTYMVLNTTTTIEVSSNDNNDENNANKWTAMLIDLFKDFKKICLSTMNKWAESVWTVDDATLKASNGVSETYVHRAFSEFIFTSVASNLQKSIQNLISNS